MANTDAFYQIISNLPPHLQEIARKVPPEIQKSANEIRLRTGKPLVIYAQNTIWRDTHYLLTCEDLDAVIERSCRSSVHSVLEQIKNGYLTVQGGHRIGICGTATVKQGEIFSFRQISSLNMRIAQQIKGVGAEILPSIRNGNTIHSTLIFSPPGLGKTTVLRDMVRLLSDGDGYPPLRVGVADQRGEIAALYQGTAQLDVGEHTDIIEGCSKAQALMILLRGMNPQVLVADEITAQEDMKALELASGCGVGLLCTAHGNTLDDLQLRPLYRQMMEKKLFSRLVQIKHSETGREYSVRELK